MPRVVTMELELEDDGQEGWMLEVMRKKERLARMEKRRNEWEAGYICKGIVKDIMESVARSESENMIKNELDGVMDTALQKSRVEAIMVDIKEYNLERVIIMERKGKEHCHQM